MKNPHLVFTLASNMASHGYLAGNEERGSEKFPLRSSITGLLASAMGLERDHDPAIFSTLEVSVIIFSSGEPLSDYHTIQTFEQAGSRGVTSRPEALALKKSSTAITRRDYRTSSCYGVVVSGGGEKLLKTISAALNSPVWPLYAGRKCCTLSFPPMARVVEAGDVREAIDHIVKPDWFGDTPPEIIVSEKPLDGHRVFQEKTFQDVAIDLERRHYGYRSVFMTSLRGATQ